MFLYLSFMWYAFLGSKGGCTSVGQNTLVLALVRLCLRLCWDAFKHTTLQENVFSIPVQRLHKERLHSR